MVQTMHATGLGVGHLSLAVQQITGCVHWARAAANPVCDKLLFAGVTDYTKQISGLFFNGDSHRMNYWSSIPFSSRVLTDALNNVDVIFKARSSDALVVFSKPDAGTSPVFMTKALGSTSWSAAKEVISSFFTGREAQWIQLASDPNSDSVALALCLVTAQTMCLQPFEMAQHG